MRRDTTSAVSTSGLLWPVATNKHSFASIPGEVLRLRPLSRKAAPFTNAYDRHGSKAMLWPSTLEMEVSTETSMLADCSTLRVGDIPH
jgi:hypothetical protein